MFKMLRYYHNSIIPMSVMAVPVMRTACAGKTHAAGIIIHRWLDMMFYHTEAPSASLPGACRNSEDDTYEFSHC